MLSPDRVSQEAMILGSFRVNPLLKIAVYKREREKERDPLRRHIQPISIKSGRRGQEAGMGMWKAQKP